MERILFNELQLAISIQRLCHQLIENHHPFQETILIGLQPRGIYFAERIHTELRKETNLPILLGKLDATFHRDDYRHHSKPLLPSETKIDFSIENKNVVLIDDVLFTGRTVRAALDAMMHYGRPKKVELLVLVDRLYTRELPIEPSYVGKKVNTLKTQFVAVELLEQKKEKDLIYIVDQKQTT